MTNRYVPGFLVVAALIAAAVVVALAVGSEEKAAPVPIIEPPVVVATEVPDARREFVTSGRGNLSVCLDGAGGVSPTLETEVSVRRALEAVLSSVSLASADATVVRGCPNPALLSAVLAGESFDRVERNSAWSRAQFVGDEFGPITPSPHRVFVYVMDSEMYAAAFGSEAYVSTGEEFVCDGICHAVTRGLYLPMGAENEVLQAGLLEVLNLLNGEQLRELEDRRD